MTWNVHHVGDPDGNGGRGYSTAGFIHDSWREEPGFEVVADGFPSEEAAVAWMRTNQLPMFRPHDPRNPTMRY